MSDFTEISVIRTGYACLCFEVIEIIETIAIRASTINYVWFLGWTLVVDDLIPRNDIILLVLVCKPCIRLNLGKLFEDCGIEGRS